MTRVKEFPLWIRGLRQVYNCLFLIRFNLIILSAGWFLLQTDQGRDSLISYVAGDDWLIAGFWFFLWIFYWAFSIWFFSRTMFRFRFPTTPTTSSGKGHESEMTNGAVENGLERMVFHRMKEYTPRLLGTLAFLAVAHALWSAHKVVEPQLAKRLVLWVGLSFVLIIPFFMIVNFRRHMSDAVGKKLKKRFPVAADSWLGKGLRTTKVADDPLYENLTDLFSNPWGVVVLIAAGIGVTAFVFSIIDPVTIGTAMSAVLLFFLWAGSWLPLGSLITFIGNKYGVPMITILLISAVVFSGSNDNHEIRTLGNLPKRPTVDTSLELWRENQLDNKKTNLVLVATAGGGIRAAYWTATVLCDLQGRTRAFDDALFAVSGVSGGSVGASVYRALLSDAVPDGKICAKARAILSGKFLGPAIAGLLYADLAQRFLPNVGLPDRGVALEKGWEHAYKKVMKSNRFAESLLTINESRPWPALMLNATRVETGRRSVASNLKLKYTGSGLSFAVLDDQLEDIGHDISLSSAAHNSARFPGVSPAGHWKDAEGEIEGRLVDGGYFENFGAETLVDLLMVIDWKSEKWKAIKPVVIAISSDPALESPYVKAPDQKAGRFAPELYSPIEALLKTRTAHGIEALRRLEQETNAIGGDFYHLRMCVSKKKGDDDEELDPPLGWSLSKVARKTIDGYLEAECNKATYELLLKRLSLASNSI